MTDMRENAHQIDYKVKRLGEIVIDKWLTHEYTYDDHYIDVNHDRLEIVFWYGDDSHTEVFSLTVLNMTNDEFEQHLDFLKDEQWKKEIERVKQKKFEEAKELILEEEREYQLYLEIRMEDWDNGCVRDFRSNSIDITTTCKWIYTIISQYGYTSQSKADQNQSTSTSMDVKEILVHKCQTKSQKDFFNNLDIDFSPIWEIKLVDGDVHLSDFNHNMITLQRKLENGILTLKDIGMLSYLIYRVFFYEKSDDVKYILPENMKVGDKLQNLEVIYDGCHTFEGHYGVTNILTFILDGNIRLKWVTGTNLVWLNDQEVKKGDKLMIVRTTVKDLKDDKQYGKSVIITRSKIEAK